ncbi:MAG: GNAT family N-acetyltransferase [Culicoidibacterales bacterium]
MQQKQRFRIIIDSETKTDYVSSEQLYKRTYNDNYSSVLKAIRKTPTFNQKAAIVARVRGSIVGHIMFSSIHIDKTKNAAFIGPIVVDSAYIESECCKNLISAACIKAAELGYDSIYTTGDATFLQSLNFMHAPQVKLANTLPNTPIYVQHFNDIKHIGQIHFTVEDEFITQIFSTLKTNLK